MFNHSRGPAIAAHTARGLGAFSVGLSLLARRRRRRLVLPLIGETPIPVHALESTGRRVGALIDPKQLRATVHALDARRLAGAAGPFAAAALERARRTDPRVAIGGGVALLALAAIPLVIAANRRSKAGKGGTTDLPREGVIERAVTVNAPRDELFRRWRDFTAAPTWMEIVETVEDLGGDRHRWTVRTPGDNRMSYETIITEEREGEVLAWESAPGAKIRSTNRLEFRDAPGGRGTEIHAAMTYDPPLGPLGKLAALATQKAPELQVRRDLRRFKQLVEAGEIATTEGPGAAPSSRDNKK